MVQRLTFIFTILISFHVKADDVYFQKDKKDCFIQSYKNGILNEVNEELFYDRVLNVKALPRNPHMVAFKKDETIYVTSKNCVADQEMREEVQSIVAETKPEQINNELSSYAEKTMFVELQGGLFSNGDDSQVSRDYNETFPSTTTNPTVWSKAGRGNYSEGPLVSLTVGFKQSPVRYFAFKLRSFSGTKTEDVTLTDVNSGLSETGSWEYKDSFLNLLAGYRFQFLPDSYWKPSIGAYLGLSRSSTSMTDNSVTYNLHALGAAFLAEAGLDYVLSESWAVGGFLGLEFLGARSLKFDGAESGTGIKTKMSYNHTYLTMGVKYAF